MTKTNALIVIITVLVLGLYFASKAEAQVQTTVTVVIECNNYNYAVSPRCTAPPDYFVVEANGEVWGHLTNGIQFTQTNVTNELGVRMQRFNLEQAYWYITDRGVIYADSDLQALSIYLTL